MPITSSAKKAMKRSAKLAEVNKFFKVGVKKTLKESRKTLLAKTGDSAKTLQVSYSALDKAAKKGLIHKNTAARTKSRLMKLANKA